MDKLEDITYCISRLFCVFAAKMLDYRLRIYGGENLPEGRAIIASNHASYLDPAFLGIGLGKINFVARDMNPEGKPVNWLFQKWLEAIGTIKVERGKIKRNALLRIMKELKGGNKIAIFPEGTRSIDGKLGELNEGIALIAELSDSPIVPASINGTYKLWPRNGRMKYSGDVVINVCKPLYPDKSINDKSYRREDLLKRLRSELEKSLIIA